MEFTLGDVERLIRESEGRVRKDMQDFEERTESRMKMHFEEMQGQVRLAAEGYGMNLDRIERELKALNAKMDTKFGDHEQVLINHNERISALERR